MDAAFFLRLRQPQSFLTSQAIHSQNSMSEDQVKVNAKSQNAKHK